MFNFNLRGLGDLLRLGKKGIYIKKDGDKVQFRNSDDTDFINGQALDPVDPQDVVTLQYFQDNSDLATFNLNKSLYKNLNYQSASPSQIGVENMPSLGLAYKVLIKVKTAFDGTNPLLTIGESGNNSRLASVNLSDLSEGDLYVVTISEIYSSATTINAYLSPDSSTQGEIDVTVLYTISDNAPIAFAGINDLIIPVSARSYPVLPTGFASSTFLGSFSPNIGDKRFSQQPTFCYAKVNGYVYIPYVYSEWNGSSYDFKSCILKVDNAGNYVVDKDIETSTSLYVPRFVKGTDIYLSVNANGGWKRYDTLTQTITNITIADKDNLSLIGLVTNIGVIEEGTPVALQSNDSTVYLSNPDISNPNAPTLPLTFNLGTASLGVGATGLLVNSIGDIKVICPVDETSGGGIVVSIRSNAPTYSATYYVMDRSDSVLATLRKVGDGNSTDIVNSVHYNKDLNLLYITSSTGEVRVFDASAGTKNLANGGDTPEFVLSVTNSSSTLCPMLNGNILLLDTATGGPNYIFEKDINNTTINSLEAGQVISAITPTPFVYRCFAYNNNFYTFIRYTDATNEYHLEKITE